MRAFWFIERSFSFFVPVARPSYTFNGIPDPFWISGFVSGDGSFFIQTHSNNNYKLGTQVQLVFAITLNQRDTDIIKGILNYLLPGESKYIYFSDINNSVKLSLTKLDHIIEIIIPFFNKYPLIGLKTVDFDLFKEVAILIENKDHLTESGLNKILTIKEQMNKYE